MLVLGIVEKCVFYRGFRARRDIDFKKTSKRLQSGALFPGMGLGPGFSLSSAAFGLSTDPESLKARRIKISVNLQGYPKGGYAWLCLAMLGKAKYT